MYIQITTKCNMECAHCAFSCTMRGRHMEWDTFMGAVAFMKQWDDTVSIGGGEPTLHPQFFDILKACLGDFDYVWMATNGSQTDTMLRLANIINGEDFIDDYDCTCDPDDLEDGYECECWIDAQEDSIYQEDKLSVALSLDDFHAPIDEKIINMWNRAANIYKRSNFEIRNTSSSTQGIIAQGRAKHTGAGWNNEDCICPGIIIKPSGKIKLCGCENAPYIGDVWAGITDKWEKVLENDNFRDTGCYNKWKNNK